MFVQSCVCIPLSHESLSPFLLFYFFVLFRLFIFHDRVARVDMPPPAGQFLAMSVFFYGMDCLHHLGPTKLAAWPNPSLAELRDASKAFCAMDWNLMMHEDEEAVSVQGLIFLTEIHAGNTCRALQLGFVEAIKPCQIL